jgi:hypothetical protein
LRAVGHRKTPVEDAGALCTTIIAKLLESGAKASLSPADIIVATTDTLQYFDEAAAVQYAAYHRGSS